MTKNRQRSQLDLASVRDHWPFDDGNFAPFHSLRREVDELFSQFTDRFSVEQDGKDRFKSPAIDVTETDEAFEIVAEFPGVEENDIDVTIADNILTLHAEKLQKTESEEANSRISECRYGVFERSLSLPFSCDADNISANYADGVLKLSIPKPSANETTPKKITIKSAA